MEKIIKICTTDLTGEPKEFEEFFLSEGRTGQKNEICDFHLRNRKEENTIMVFRDSKEVRRFADWLIENVKGKHKEETSRILT